MIHYILSATDSSKITRLSFILAAALTLLPTQAFAQATGNLDLSGTVAATCNVTVTPVGGVADSLPLGAAQTDLTVASVNETCNDPDGYTLTAQSSQSSVLTPVGTSTDSVPYSFRFGGTVSDLSGGGAVTVTDVNAATGAAGVDKSVQISYANPGFIAADTYTDTITFTIAAK